MGVILWKLYLYNKHYMLSRVYKYFLQHSYISTFSLTILYSSILFFTPYSFKFDIVVTFIFIGMLYVLTKNFFLSLFIMFLASSQFFFPAKTYQFEYASASEYAYELLPNGIFESIIVNISDICAALIILFFIKEKVSTFIQTPKKTNRLRPRVNVSIILIFLCWFVYFSISLYSSLYVSLFPLYSINLLAQYGKMAVMFFAVLYYFHDNKNRGDLFPTVLIALLLFQSVLGTYQFVKSLTNYGASEKLPSIDVEQNVDFSRVEGISGHPNGHGFVVSILVLITFPFVLKQKKKILWAITILGLVNIILSQSRTVWIALFLVSGFVYTLHAHNIRLAVTRLFKLKRLYLLLWCSIPLIFIILPRLQASSIFFTDEGGGALRIKMLSEGWQLLQLAPYAGFGAGNTVRAFLNHAPNGYIAAFPFTVHNVYLQIALESGIPAGIAFFVPFYIYIRAWFLKGRHSKLHNHALLSIVCCIIVMFTYYSFQPAYGRREFILLGIILGTGVSLLETDRLSSYDKFKTIH